MNQVQKWLPIVGQRFLREMKRQGITQTQLHELSGVGRGTINAFLHGRPAPGAKRCSGIGLENLLYLAWFANIELSRVLPSLKELGRDG